MTRAQIFLVRLMLSFQISVDEIKTISYCQYRMMGGEDSEKQLSEFVGSSMRRDAVSRLTP